MENTFAGVPLKVEYKKTRSTMSMTFDKSGTLVVYAPEKTADGDIIRFMSEHRRWIRIHHTKAEAFAENSSDVKVSDGGSIFYLGEKLTVRISGRGRIIKKEQEIIFPEGSTDESFVKWLKKRSREHLAARLTFISEKTGIGYMTLRISGARGSWGSCTSTGTVSLSWRLMMCPPDVIDYVIVHELCHRHHMDHSSEFWNEVEDMMPDYKEKKKWLDDNSYLMDLFV